MSLDPAVPRSNDPGTAGVLLRPPVLVLGTLLLARAADHFLPRPFEIPHTAWLHGILGAAMIAGGLALAIAGIRNFSRADTPVPTVEPTRALVTTGIHGKTRNPIYLGMLLLYAGIGLAARSPWTLLLIVPVALTLRCGVIAKEEAYLERRFGDAYRDYTARVRRWL